jgi:hypothetical protein
MRKLIGFAAALAIGAALVACGSSGGKSTGTPTKLASSTQSSCTASVVATPGVTPAVTPTVGPPPTVTAQPTTTADGLQIIDIQLGTGAVAQATSCVVVKYIGWLENGQIFDSADIEGGPVQFPLDQVIKGWGEGVPGMKVGGTRRLIIPPALAYGSAGRGTIPANATLTFDITLLDIKS